MTITRRKTLLVPLCFAACAALVSGSAFAQAYPSKPIRMIVPTTAGGGNDYITRTVAKKLEELLNWQIVVENKVGASGIIATDYVAMATPSCSTALSWYKQRACTTSCRMTP
jgi:tripartite-type tricarboxylate transporter receptor subunit TctC